MINVYYRWPGLLLLLPFACADVRRDQTETTETASALTERARVEAYLNELIPEQSVLMRSEVGGEEVACIDFYAQRGVKDLMKRGRSMESIRAQRAPKSMPTPNRVSDAVTVDGPSVKNGCPPDSVPMRRPTVDEILAFGSLDEYLHRAPPANNEYEYAYAQQNASPWGLGGTVNIWSPTQVTGSTSIGPTNGGKSKNKKDHVTAQLWAWGGTGSSKQTVEAGWVKWPNQSSRLFVFFTPNNYNFNTSCWNNDCGFIQTNGSVVLNGAFNSYSVSGGTQYEAPFYLLKDTFEGDWWFWYNGAWVGYWPRTLFNNGIMVSNANFLAWGGEVYDADWFLGGQHTASNMGGDGSFASVGYARAAYIRNMQVFDINLGAWIDANPALQTTTNGWCYSLQVNWLSNGWNRMVYFGGPGYSSGACPL